MTLKDKIENNVFLVLVGAVVAAAGVTWTVAEAVRVSPKSDQLAVLERQLADAKQDLENAKHGPDAMVSRLQHELQSAQQDIAQLKQVKDPDCADKILKAIELLKAGARAQLRASDVARVREAVKGLDPGRRAKIFSHVPNGDWSGVAEDLVSPFNGERAPIAQLILRYFSVALAEVGVKDLPPPEVEIVWPD